MKTAFIHFLCAATISMALPATANSATLVYTENQTTISYSVNWTSGMTVEQAMQTAGPDYVTGWSHQYSGNSLLMVLATGTFPATPSTTDGKLGTPYWLLCVDSKPASMGMTQQTIPSSTSEVKWIWTSKYKCQ
ncbi:hypothetical protein HGO34_17340 [Agrobacterium vitis]|uniref:DUF4430 domain-containing protein n=1 Tax=Agrobacterium vitis TaxID=373 RepID=A0AAE5AXT7_AGRVI|nr:hypothetical protein [Agrobacterium vitis]MCF1497621.1 hypothetical protein [Allorhizobium sp. Av2]MCM2441490.1 hypothetical protein [Agrobacterium vitis]MUZ59422.1 hypothetical protein [Agrobacterium vitis]MVA67941.1 hypothetical protein [Agrobacterium vitis]MVA89697.1 hypothetical protein [Agrobacterium vitis]